MSDTPMYYMRDKLYFCDGQACDEYNKQYCYLYGGECRHTPHKEHSLSMITPDFPPTKFIPLSSTGIRIETFDEQAIFEELKHHKQIRLE